MARDGWRHAAVLLTAAAQAGAPALVPLGVQSQDIGARSEAVRTPVVPAGYAFAIWGLIFAAALVFAVWQVLPAQRRDPLLRRIGWPAAATFAGCAAWEVTAQAGAPDAVLAGVILITLGAALLALLRLSAWPEPLAARRWLLIALPIGLLAGWLSAASFANLSTALEAARTAPWPDGVWLALIAGAAVFAVGVLLRTGGQPAYAAAAVWALVAVAVANRDAEPVTFGVACVGAAAVLLATLHPRRRRSRSRARG